MILHGSTVSTLQRTAGNRATRMRISAGSVGDVVVQRCGDGLLKKKLLTKFSEGDVKKAMEAGDKGVAGLMRKTPVSNVVRKEP